MYIEIDSLKERARMLHKTLGDFSFYSSIKDALLLNPWINEYNWTNLNELLEMLKVKKELRRKQQRGNDLFNLLSWENLN